MAEDDLFFASIGEVAARIRAGELSPVELTRAALARIEALEPSLHAYARVTLERALADAERAGRALTRGEPAGPLHGVPIALKDLVDTAGIATEAGTRVMAGRVPAADATVAARLKAAGAVLLGKLAMTEGAFADHRPERPTPVNPWRDDLWTGVSSSGAGVAVAAGLCFGALGSDTGGSIRFPSVACGITGLKPTWGRVSRSGVVPLAQSLDHVGPMARSAEDCGLLLQAIAGADPLDPTAVQARPEPPRNRKDLRGLRIGVDPACLADIHPEVVRAIEAALETCVREGAVVRDIALPDFRPFASGWAVTCGVEAAIFHQPWFEARPEDYGRSLGSLIGIGRSVPASAYAELHAARLALAGGLDALFETVDLIAVPAIPVPTPSVAELEAGQGDPETVAAMLRFTAPFNYSGHPTLSLPAGEDCRGLPLGFQLVAPKLAEAELLAAGIAYQRATDWHLRRPPGAEARTASPMTGQPLAGAGVSAP